MKFNLEQLIEIAEFVQDKMTEAQALRHLDSAKCLDQNNLAELEFHALGTKLYPMLLTLRII
jgi:hypothetical protein